MPFYDYRLALGWNVALGSLTNAEDVFGQPPVTQPLDRFPVRRLALAGLETGGGRIDTEWQFLDVLPLAALDSFLTTYFAAGASVAVQVTLYTRLRDLDEYRRYNAYMVQPKPGRDYVVEDLYAMALRLPFRRLVQI